LWQQVQHRQWLPGTQAAEEGNATRHDHTTGMLTQVPITGIIERDEGTTARRLMMDSGTISREERRWLELELGPGEEVSSAAYDG